MQSEAEAREVLGVGTGAGPDEVRRAYRRLARRHHPDAGGDAAAFHRIRAAASLLLDDGRPRRPVRPATSPSRSGVHRPSTATRVSATGVGESMTGPRWHDAAVATDTVDWELAVPEPPHKWTAERLLAALARAEEEDVIAPATGVSRRPGSSRRAAQWLSGDLLSRWWIRPSTSRGIVGHDVEIRIDLTSRRARRLADGADWPLGWSRERRPSLTVATLVLTPSRDVRQTAVRAVDVLTEGLDRLGWPLDDWHHVREGA